MNEQFIHGSRNDVNWSAGDSKPSVLAQEKVWVLNIVNLNRKINLQILILANARNLQKILIFLQKLKILGNSESKISILKQNFENVARTISNKCIKLRHRGVRMGLQTKFKKLLNSSRWWQKLQILTFFRIWGSKADFTPKSAPLVAKLIVFSHFSTNYGTFLNLSFLHKFCCKKCQGLWNSFMKC